MAQRREGTAATYVVRRKADGEAGMLKVASAKNLILTGATGASEAYGSTGSKI